ncbi:hypothetical protein [Nitrosomonas ureae]|uniref:Uncharacterized protein n=1 Tax=Nitrosomonas ureae TaxID=44577 RepID=A0A1H2ER48_9PROT|nr:hypothetical protein [Nitrosomonas ureae]ALQ51857.1 hypothetical protein ATY38_11895 [Nitrosomonas ureae]SDT97597.1 hypothetical protein SAMN05216406_11494 [Nitrosomonas ureae]
MATRKKAKEPNQQEAKTLIIKNQKGKSEERKLAEVLLSPTALNAFTAETFIATSARALDLTEAVDIMNGKTEKIIAGDLSELESTLIAQAVSLNAIFNTLAKRSAQNMGNYLKSTEVYMRLALKAQAQCARTIEILAAIKNPPIIYAKQANIAHGHQQINNNTTHTHTGKNINSSNELLSEDNNETLDTRRTIETSGVNQKLAAVETIHGSKDINRKSNIQPECIYAWIKQVSKRNAPIIKASKTDY